MGSFFFLHFAGLRIESQASCKISKDGQFGPGIELQTSTLSFESKCTVYGLIFCAYESTNVGSRYNNDCATRSLLYDGANTTQEPICKSYTPAWSKHLRGLFCPDHVQSHYWIPPKLAIWKWTASDSAAQACITERASYFLVLKA